MATDGHAGWSETDASRRGFLLGITRRSFALLVLLASLTLSIGKSDSAFADTCWPMTLQVHDAQGGSLDLVESSPGACPPGQYLDSTTFQVQANATEGWRVASVTGADPVPGIPGRYIGLFSGPVTVTATFALELGHGDTSPTEVVAQGSWYYYVIDVPEGASGLSVGMNGTNDADLYTRFGQLPNGSQYDCRPFQNTSNESCSHSSPAAGAWLIGVNGFAAADAVITVFATIEACWEVQVQSEPPGIPIQVTPAQNCPGGYQHGTDVTFTANPPLANPFTDWRVQSIEQDTTNPLTLDITGGTLVVGDFATPMTDGQDLQDQYFPPGVHRAFYVDIPAGTGQLKFSLQPTGGAIEPTGYELQVGSGIVCANGIMAGSSGDCVFEDPPAGRMWLVAASNDGATVDIQADVERCVQVNAVVSPPGSGTIAYDPPMTCTGGYLEGETVQLTATPEPGYVFATWGPNLLLPISSISTGVPATDLNVTAFMAPALASNVPSGDITGPGESWFYIDVPVGAHSLTVTTSDPSDELAVTEEFSPATLCPSEPGNTCVLEPPYDGRWFVRVKKTAATTSTVTATLVRCYELRLTVHPAGSGTATADPPASDGCLPGWYLPGTDVGITAISNPGYAFVLWDGRIFSTRSFESLPTTSSTEVIDAHFGPPLSSGVPLSLPGADVGYHFAYIDVPEGTGVIRLSATAESAILGIGVGNDDGLDWRFDCAYIDTPLAKCSQLNPAPGRWWVGLYQQLAGDLSITATLEDAPLCHFITKELDPAAASEYLIRILTPPNCEGGRYQHGTEVHYIVAEEAPGFALKEFKRGNGEAPPSSSFTIYEHTTLHATYAARLPLGTTSNIVIPPSGVANFFFDTPAEATEIFLSMSNGQFITAGVESGPLACGFTPLVPPGGGGCGIGGLDDGPRRWWITLTGTGATPDITITITPEMAGVIDYLSPGGVYKNSADVELSVHGYGFVSGSTVYFDGVALPTTFVSANLLTATIPAVRLAGDFGKYEVVVRPPSTGTLRVPTIPSNAATFYLQRRSSDANCDATTAADDALAVLRYLAGFEDVNICDGDANVDGIVTLADALWIRSEVVGLIEPQPAQ